MADKEVFNILAFFCCITYLVIGMLTQLELLDSQNKNFFPLHSDTNVTFVSLIIGSLSDCTVKQCNSFPFQDIADTVLDLIFLKNILKGENIH